MAAIPTSCFLAPKSCHESMVKSGRLSPGPRERSVSAPVPSPPGSPMTERAPPPLAVSPFAKLGQILQNQIKTNNTQLAQPTVTVAGKLAPTRIDFSAPTVNSESTTTASQQQQPNRRKSDLSPEAIGMSA